MPTGIKVRDNESFEKALRRFTKACEKAGLMSELRKRKHFEKPSEKKKRKFKLAQRKQRRLQMLENQ
ncbi:MAG: 30S ribosomal protein S21 [bacterium]|jgi:small subunit ribosomal protein S21